MKTISRDSESHPSAQLIIEALKRRAMNWTYNSRDEEDDLGGVSVLVVDGRSSYRTINNKKQQTKARNNQMASTPPNIHSS